MHNFTVRLLALRQPVAQDLRAIVAALSISGDIERIADYAANVAKRSLVLNQLPPVGPVAGVVRLGRLVQEIVKTVLDAYVEEDVEKAVRVWRQDEEVDDMYTSLFRELLTYMMEDPRNITPSIHLMFMAKNIERIGDHATNIAETIHFLVRGKPLPAARPKGDASILPEPVPHSKDAVMDRETVAKPMVMVVEDEAALATMLRYNLEKEGYRVCEAADGEEALTLMAERKPDLVVLDWMLPVLSGIEVCRQIRRKPCARATLPVIMLTARGEEGDKVRGLNTGADDYMTKPFSLPELMARIRALLRRAKPTQSKGVLPLRRHHHGPGGPPRHARRPRRPSRPDRIPPAAVS